MLSNIPYTPLQPWVFSPTHYLTSMRIKISLLTLVYESTPKLHFLMHYVELIQTPGHHRYLQHQVHRALTYWLGKGCVLCNKLERWIPLNDNMAQTLRIARASCHLCSISLPILMQDYAATEFSNTFAQYWVKFTQPGLSLWQAENTLSKTWNAAKSCEDLHIYRDIVSHRDSCYLKSCKDLIHFLQNPIDLLQSAQIFFLIIILFSFWSLLVYWRHISTLKGIQIKYYTA